MRCTAILAALFALSVSSVALAQEVPYSRTLDEQLERIKQGKPSIPQKGEQPTARQTSKTSAVSQAPAAVYRDSKGEVINSVGGDAIPSLPLSAMQAGEVKFITGGVGDEEMAQLKSVENEYNVRILVASMAGEYLSELAISLLDSTGKQLATSDNAGPYFYASLKPGNYTMEITNVGGIKKAAKFTAPAQGFIKPVVRY